MPGSPRNGCPDPWEYATTGGKPTFPATIKHLILPETQKDYTDASGGSAVIVRGNQVSQPLGKALWIRRGFGPISVTGNSLEGFGDPVNGVALVSTLVGWKNGGVSMGRPGGGACVEIIDLGKAIDIDGTGIDWQEMQWTKEGGTVDGGMISFADNQVKLSWNRIEGFASAVVCSSTDSVAFQGNSVHVVCGSAYDPGAASNKMAQFYLDMLTKSALYSFVVATAYVGALSSALVSGNRLAGATFDVLFSCIAGPPLTTGNDFADVINGIVVASNCCSHGIFESLAGDNIPLLSDGEDTLNTITFAHETFLYKTFEVTSLGGVARVVLVQFP